jgi:hypothetical protein
MDDGGRIGYTTLAVPTEGVILSGVSRDFIGRCAVEGSVGLSASAIILNHRSFDYGFASAQDDTSVGKYLHEYMRRCIDWRYSRQKDCQRVAVLSVIPFYRIAASTRACASDWILRR